MIAEAGARDENGTVRPFIESLGPAGYLAPGMRPGPGADVACDAADLPSPRTFGVVVATEMLEHARDWKAALAGLITALEPGGLLLLTTRSEGFPYHGYPGDWHRFSAAAMTAILDGAGLAEVSVTPDPEAPGVSARARKPAGWPWPARTGRDAVNVGRVPQP
jgi:SAM-dependent methyltransferase